MKSRSGTLESLYTWNRHDEEESFCSRAYFSIQGLLCILNMLFGYFILISHYNELRNYKSNMVILLITIFGELLIYLLSVFLMLFVRTLCGIRSSLYFLSVISLINLTLQFIFYYICFISSVITLILWYFSIIPSNILTHFLLNKEMSSELIHNIIVYFTLEAIISSIEVLSSIPIVINVVNYGLSKEIDKIKGKPLVEFYSNKGPLTYIRHQNYGKALEDIRNNNLNESEHYYIYF